MRSWLGAVALSCALTQSPLAAEAYWLPHDLVVDVRDFGAKGDGKTDDTASIREAIAAARVAQGSAFWPARLVYFPAGTYLVTDTLHKHVAGRFEASMALMGESRESVTLKLRDHASGFTDAEKPRAVVYASSGLLRGSPHAGGKDYLGLGEGNDAYGNYVEDMTIDVGRGNPGAIAIDFIANNVGAIRRVRLLAPPGSGRTALSLERKWPGPLLIAEVSVDGFETGLAVRHGEYGITVDKLVLRNQSHAALQNVGNTLALRNIEIEGGAGLVENLAPSGLLVIAGMRMAIESESCLWLRNKGYVVFDDVHVTFRGKGSTRCSATTAVTRSALAGSHVMSEALPEWTPAVTRAPVEPRAARSKWVSVRSFGAETDSDKDATDAIRAAFLSGAEAVYFPSGRYLVSGSIDVPAHVRLVRGMFSSISVSRTQRAQLPRDRGILRTTSGGPPLLIERLAFDNLERGSQVAIEHAGARTLSLRDVITAGASTVRRAQAGRLLLENVCCGSYVFQGKQPVEARQLNTEGSGTRIANHGAPLSILGLKAEQNCTVIENLHGAKTQVLGGLIYLVNRPDPRRPAFINGEGSTLIASYVEAAYRPEARYLEYLRQVSANGETTAILAELYPAHGLARVVPYLSTRRPSATSPLPSSVRGAASSPEGAPRREPAN